MPIYEYECDSCKKRYEVLQRLSDPPLEKCSSCSGKVHKVLSAPSGLVFKGSGWYVTDYAKKNGHSSSESKGDQKGASGEGKPAAPESPKKETPSSSPPPSKDS